MCSTQKDKDVGRPDGRRRAEDKNRNPRFHQKGKEERKGWIPKAEEFNNFKKGRTEESIDLELRENGK